MKSSSVKHVTLNVYALDMLNCPDGWRQMDMHFLGTVTLAENWTTRTLFKALRENGWVRDEELRIEDTTEWDFGYEVRKRRGRPLLFVRDTEYRVPA